MDYLQTLEFKMAALQRKIRLLQDLRFFAETASPEELAAFGDELRSVSTASGTSLGSILGGLLAGEGSAAARPAAPPRPPLAAAVSGPATAPAQAAEPAAESAVAVEAGEGTASAGGGDELSRVLSSIEGSMRPVPAGSFLMGSDQAESERPAHKVSLGGFRLCDHLVTCAEYALFVAANPRWQKDRADPELRDGHYLEDWSAAGFPEGRDEHPVAYVSYAAAAAFAEWVGKRLPTEAEWEYAARGGLVGKKYPNGDQMNDKLANFAKQFRGTTPVRKFEPNGFGLYDMAGNLFEWCSDWFAPYQGGESLDPKGPPEGEYRVVRGGSWMSGAGALRISARVDMEESTCGQVGIRLAD